MQIGLFELVAPHYCCSCGEIGAVLCEYCKYSIGLESTAQCVVCERPTGGNESLCRACCTAYCRAWCVGKKSDELERVIEVFKFGRAKAAHKPLAQLLDSVVPSLPPETIVVPVPTVAAHIRERGYDHAALIAKRFAVIRGHEYCTALVRRTNTRQRGANRRQREAQAKVAFGVNGNINGTYLLVDDVFTTGATIKYAAKALVDAGAREVWVAVVARQPLE